jgi:hypothetical protein
LVRVLRDEVAHCSDRERLLLLARQWLYDHRLLIVHDRVIRAMVAAALVELEASTGHAIMTSVSAETRKRWISALDTPRPDGGHCQSWLWSAPARHSTRQITEVLERIAFLTDLGVDRRLGDLDDVLVRRYARRFGSAARGDPIYDACVQLGKLLRTVFLADYFVNAAFRRELRRVLNRGESSTRSSARSMSAASRRHRLDAPTRCKPWPTH